jgi:colanic acid/amylovoran biosynthesis protein
MRIVIDNSGYQLGNMGDVSMLQVAVDRLNGLWPDAVIQIITRNPVRLMNYCPGAIPLSSEGKECFRGRHLISRLRMKLPQVVSRRLDEAEFSAKYRHSGLFWSVVDLKNRVRGIRMSEDIKSFRDSIRNANLVIASGGGYLTDSFKRYAIELLATLGMAANLGKRTAMFGQGIGPIQDTELFQVCSDVLSKVDFICLRESRAGIPLLRKMNISEEKVIVTGDDAIGMVLDNIEDNLGSGIGINVRAAYYSDIDLNALNPIKNALTRVAEGVNANLIPVPISFHDADSDIKTSKILLGEHNKEIQRLKEIDTPKKVIKRSGYSSDRLGAVAILCSKIRRNR